MRKTAIVAAVVVGALAVGGVSATAAVANMRDTTWPSAIFTGLATPTVTRERAVQIAQAQVPGSQMIEAELDNWRGVLVWEVEFFSSSGIKTEVNVDATTGAVRKIDHEQDDSSDDHRGSDD